MGILQIQNIDLSFGDRTLLNNVSLVLSENARAALVGGNGEGKSTLMKIVSGSMQSDNGIITKTRGMRISYLPQSDIVFKNSTVFEEIEKGFSHFEENLSRQREIENLLSTSSSDALLDELNALQEKLLDSNYYNREAIIYLIAKGLGFTKDDMHRECCEFSGGYQMRIALAKVLCENPDLMMLDEPTNYLDIEARTWLLSFLKTYKGSLLLVCHDRYFLDETVNEVYELFNSKLTRYSGNYSFYEKQRKLEIEQLEASYKKQQAEIEKTEEFIERFRYKATKSKQVQSRIKQLDKLEPVVVPSHLKTLHFTFPEPPHSPNDMVIIENLCKNYDKQSIFKDFSITISKGQRLAVTGHNGIGKSTLLRIIAQKDTSYSGISRLGVGVKIGYYAQDAVEALDLNGTVLDQVSMYGTEAQMRNALGSFLFSGDDIYKKASVLSGGERSRLALLKILLQPASLLILDEPTNHLDINSKDMLLRALKKYNGTIIFVSHDSYFISEIADSILYLSESKPELFNGDYDYFQWKLNERLGLENQQKINTKSQEIGNNFNSSSIDRVQANKNRNRKNKLKNELSNLIERIEKVDQELAKINQEMNLVENYSDVQKINALVNQKNTLEEQKAELELTWLEKTEEYESEFGSL